MAVGKGRDGDAGREMEGQQEGVSFEAGSSCSDYEISFEHGSSREYCNRPAFNPDGSHIARFQKKKQSSFKAYFTREENPD